MSRVLDALKRAEAERSTLRSAKVEAPPAPVVTRPAPPQSAYRRWRLRRRNREILRARRRAEAAARQAALLARLDSIERRIGELDETVTKQLGELEPRLLHAFELRSRGLERELASLTQRTELASGSDERLHGLRRSHLAGLVLLAFAVGAAIARACAA
jgi:hypothetical protein